MDRPMDHESASAPGETFRERWAPGQTPETDRERMARRVLMKAACDAEEAFGLDELERWAQAREEGDR